MQRQKPYKLIPHQWLWWKKIEPILIEGIEMRADGLADGRPEVTLPKVAEPYRKHIEELMRRADWLIIARRSEHERRGGSEVAEG